MLERSKAIKCPSAAVHLAGTKKVQQVLACPGKLERCVRVTTSHLAHMFGSFFVPLVHAVFCKICLINYIK